MPSLELCPGIVYRCFDKKDVLIYIGATSTSVARRMSGHRQRSAWHIFVARIAEEPFDNIHDAYRAETEAIERERPIFNRQENWSRESQAQMRTYLAGAGRLDLLPAVSMRLGRQHVDEIDERLLARAAVETGGNRSEMRRRLLLYALEHMPTGWNQEITEEQLRGLVA